MNLKNFEHLRKYDACRFKTEMVGDKEFTILCYMIADPALWDAPMGLEARGHVFDDKGDLVSMPFEKFFNYRENKFTQPEVVGNLKIKNVFEKRDGSLITGVLVKDQLVWKTKKSFYSDMAAEVQCGNFHKEENLARALADINHTAIWEYTSPNNKIVIDYGSESKLTLLAIRKNDSGVYLNWNNVLDFAESYGVTTINSIAIENCTTLNDLEAMLENAEGIEGYVVELENGMRLKLKSPWYLRLHHVNTELRERDVAEMFADEALDDLKSTISLAGKSLEVIEEVERRVSAELEGIAHEVDVMAEKIKQCETRKQAAELYRSSVVFGMAIKQIEGREIDVIQFWKKNCLKQNYGLNCLYNESF